MERLGGFRLCRRLLDPEERLAPFLSADAMLGRGWNETVGGCGAWVALAQSKVALHLTPGLA